MRALMLQQRGMLKGYTLLEVLIAILIFGAMLTLASVAFNQGIKNYEGLSLRGLSFWNNTRILVLQRSISSIFDYYVRDQHGNFFPYFIGQQDLISYVSLSAVSHDLPVVVFLTKEKNLDGTFDLRYFELPVYTMNFQELERLRVYREYEKGTTFTIFSGLSEVTFSFYGFDRRRRTDLWTPAFDGKNSLTLPKIIKIDFKSGNEKDTLYFGIHVDSQRKLIYNEHYR